MEKNITIILLLLGRYEKQVAELDEKLKELRQLKEDAEIIVAADSTQWAEAPLMKMFQVENPKAVVVFDTQHDLIPAHTINLALQHWDTDYYMLALLSDPLTERFNMFLHQIRQDKDAEHDGHTKMGVKSYYIVPVAKENSEGLTPINNNLYGWAQSSQEGFCLGSFCIHKEVAKQCPKIDENPILRTGIERWYSLKVLKYSDMVAAGTDSQYVKRISMYPGFINAPHSHDLEARYISYCCGIAADERTPQQCGFGFAKELDISDSKLYHYLTGIEKAGKTRFETHYKILIVGGVWEYHHNQICFFNYLERLCDQGFATFRSVYEYKVPASIVLGYDLVIFTRCRTKNSLAMMRMAEENGIATMYMIDDNWLTIAKEHPDLGSIFVPGNENYDNFIEALGLCRATWLFSDILRADVLPYTRCVKIFSISIDPRLFTAKVTRKRTDSDLCIGFSGSMRYDDAAFRALARYARRHPETAILLMGVLSKEQEQLFQNVKTIRVNFSSYGRYAEQITAIQPDLLIAPLDNTHTLNSKCFNKYVESGIAGAACIYSHVKPYTDVITEGINGYFVDGNTDEEWYQKIESVLSDLPKLRKVQAKAMSDVLKHYTVDVLLDSFCEKISEVIRGDLRDD
ncbi:MAG: hypothetical protein IKG01_00925 [Lachnospiraceae bacterium]|nr:hypothetical protein [Lachnospiraceae bacterium]